MKFFQNSQREWERSTDLMNPNHALYQLSYTLNFLALGAGLEPAADFRLLVNSQIPATNSGTLENVVETKGIEPFTA